MFYNIVTIKTKNHEIVSAICINIAFGKLHQMLGYDLSSSLRD